MKSNRPNSSLIALMLLAAAVVPANGADPVLQRGTPQAMPDVAKPPYLNPIVDPVFGTKVTRISGDAGSPIRNLDGKWGQVVRHHYSKDQAWNADMSMLVLTRHKGKPNPLFLDARTYEPLFTIRLPGEARWHPTDPDVMLYVRDNRIGRFDVRTGKDETIVTVEGYSQFRLMSEGNFSYDGTRVAVAAKDPEGLIVAFAYDLRNHVKYPDIDLSAMPSIDWVSISALGQYVVVNGNHNGRNHRGGLDQTRVFDLQGHPVGPLWENYGEPSHYDLTVDQSGDEVAVGNSKSGVNSGKLIVRRLRDSLMTVVNSESASHSSARNYRRHGWAYATCGDDKGVFRNEIIAVKLDGSLQVHRLCHMHLVRAGYDSEGHASVSPDGTHVIWNSNWDDKEGDISVYVAEIHPRD
jgi:hypothetical protein